MGCEAFEPTPLATERKAELLNRLVRAEGQVRGLQRLLEEGAEFDQIAQQLLATRHALDSACVRWSLLVAERGLKVGHDGEGVSQQAVGEVLDRLQIWLSRFR